MRGIEKANPETLYGIFGDAAWTSILPTMTTTGFERCPPGAITDKVT
jgi:hypothetical protein